VGQEDGGSGHTGIVVSAGRARKMVSLDTLGLSTGWARKMRVWTGVVVSAGWARKIVSLFRVGQEDGGSGLGMLCLQRRPGRWTLGL
jgi:hypothetical protein